MDRERLTAHLQGENEQKIGAFVLDGADIAWKSNRSHATDFYDPYEQKVAKSILAGLPEIGVMSFGGYRNAERARLVIYPHFILTDTIETPITVLQVTGNFSFTEVSHRDFLGSLLGLGLKREKIGDIICFDQGCQVVVANEVARFICEHWRAVHQVTIKVQEIDPEQIAVEPERIKMIKTTVASLRLDAVAASGYGISRTKMVREIKGDRVKVNWKTITNPAHEIAESDVISIRGRGRVIVEEVRGETKKGRTGLLLKRLM